LQAKGCRLCFCDVDGDGAFRFGIGDCLTGAAVAGGGGFVEVNDAEAAVVDHVAVAPDVDRSSGTEDRFGVVGFVVGSQQIGFVGIVNEREFRPHVDSFDVRVLFLQFAHRLQTQAVKVRSASEQKGVHPFFRDQSFNMLPYAQRQSFAFLDLATTDETAGMQDVLRCHWFIS